MDGLGFQLKMMPSSEFSCTKFLLLIDHPQKLRKFHAMKISSYMVIHLLIHTVAEKLLTQSQYMYICNVHIVSLAGFLCSMHTHKYRSIKHR